LRPGAISLCPAIARSGSNNRTQGRHTARPRTARRSPSSSCPPRSRCSGRGYATQGPRAAPLDRDEAQQRAVAPHESATRRADGRWSRKGCAAGSSRLVNALDRVAAELPAAG
jgi:hypothetical protein